MYRITVICNTYRHTDYKPILTFDTQIESMIDIVQSKNDVRAENKGQDKIYFSTLPD